jgi:CBS domain-containing protein
VEIQPIVKEKFETFEHDQTVSEVVSKLRQTETHAGLVFRNNKYLGVVEKRRLISARINPTEVKIENYVKRAPLLSPDATVIEAAQLLIGSDVDHLPVQEGKEIVGVVSMIDLACIAVVLDDVDKLKVTDVKYLKSSNINKGDPLSTAVELMNDKHTDHLPVFDHGKLFGVLSYKDIIRKHLDWSPRRDVSDKFNQTKAAKSDFPAHDLPVSNFVTSDNLVTVPSKTLLKGAVDEMVKHKINSVFVMDGDGFQGLLSARNILQAVAGNQKMRKYSINLKGIHDVDLTEHQRNAMQTIIDREALKLQRSIKEPFTISVHLKEIKKEGKQHEFEVKLRVDAPGNMFATTKEDWDVEKALHKCFNVVKVQLDR